MTVKEWSRKRSCAGVRRRGSSSRTWPWRRQTNERSKAQSGKPAGCGLPRRVARGVATDRGEPRELHAWQERRQDGLGTLQARGARGESAAVEAVGNSGVGAAQT